MEFCTSANLVVVEAKEEEKIADPCDRQTNSHGAAAADDDDVKKKHIAIFGNKQRLLSLDMKTKVVQHVQRE